MELQLAWLSNGLDEYEAQLRIESYLNAGLDPDMAAGAVAAERYQDEVDDLRLRVEYLERIVTLLTTKLDEMMLES
jgi:hypothetical protein